MHNQISHIQEILFSTLNHTFKKAKTAAAQDAIYSTCQRPRSRDTSNDALFVDKMEIKSQQYRVVTSTEDTSAPDET